MPTPRAAPDSAARPAGSTPTPQARWSRDWATKGRCASQDPDTLFVQGKEQRLAKVLCKGCPVMAECLADALDNRTPFGVWGGMTERERRALLRARPDVENWTTVLQEMRRAGAGAW
ncbi:MAG: WhiB family transcriptional regulator [Actinomycetia bacterium]|nr:WhiB family transcriptional regulator [Actinomycetes bacterium]